MNLSSCPAVLRHAAPAMAFTAGALLIGCATPHKAEPVVIRHASATNAHVYFFRPAMDKMDRRDVPQLSVAGQSVASLPHASHTLVALPPGAYRVALKGRAGDSANWDQTAEFTLQAGKTYYVAIWHQNQPATKPAFMDAYGPAGELVFRLLNPPRGPAAARFEFVDQSVAEDGLGGLAYVAPETSSLSAK